MSLRAMNPATSKLGSELCEKDRRHALAAFVHRSTQEHVPSWSARAHPTTGKAFPVQFANDADWLAHTRFAVTKDGRLDQRVRSCYSRPTWPNNPELRKAAS